MIDRLFDWLEIFGALMFSAIIVFYLAFGVSLLAQLPFCVMLNLDRINVLKTAIETGFVIVVVVGVVGIWEVLK